ncbi:hypothetical protein R3W88_024544 [Solanum pinnatisectum]|uniref:Retrotransposon gag domain-containing protein n=1 Tax=Solanum pinnatisectum TaxID=50273 RepID=A0AAV9M0W7_9SOLN|nr:hypothetical protein R3W88_024544 [Solanum pinnatisectum]
MGDNVGDTSLTDVVVAQHIITDQNELKVQLMQQITEMRVEMQRRQDLPNPSFTFNAPADGRPPLHFPPSSAEQAQNPPSDPARNPSIIDLTTQNPHYASASYQTPPLLKIPTSKCHFLPKMPISKLVHPLKTKMLTTHKLPSVTKINIPTPRLSLKTTKPLKMPKIPPLLHPYPRKPLSKSRSPMSMTPMILSSTIMRSEKEKALEWFTFHEMRQWPNWNTLAKDFIERFAYNVEIVLDRYSLEKKKQKSNESYREFAYRWRKEAARVRPPMSEKEIVEVFVRVQEPEYYDRIMLLVGEKFAEIVKVGETIEDGLKIGKIARVAASPKSLDPPPNYQTNSYPRYQAPHPNAPNYRQMPPPQQGNYDPLRPRFEKKSARIFTPLIESRTKLFERLTVAGYIHPVGPKPVDTSSKFYRPDQRCAYHSNSVRHDTEDCINLKHKIQDLIDQKMVSLQTVVPNVNSNSLLNHGGVTINMIETDNDWCVTKAIVSVAPDNLERVVASLSIREKKKFVILTPEKAVALVSRETLARPKFMIEIVVTQGMTRPGRCYTPKELAQGVQKKDQPKRKISEAKAEEFWRKMQPKDYSIVKHLEKTPTQIFVWALLMSLQLHRQALIKALDDTYVPVGTNSDNLAAMINQVIRGHRISFCDEELPFEGKMHNKALHVTYMCRDKIINRILVDDGSVLNICPLLTLRQLKFDLEKHHQNQVNVRAFDGVQRDTLGAVNLDIQVGPAYFNVEFQVLDINTSYNLLLGRPFIHIAGAVSSTLHQLMKFVWKDQELVIYGEESHSNGYAPIVDDVSRGCDFYTVELVMPSVMTWPHSLICLPCTR